MVRRPAVILSNSRNLSGISANVTFNGASMTRSFMFCASWGSSACRALFTVFRAASTFRNSCKNKISGPCLKEKSWQRAVKTPVGQQTSQTIPPVNVVFIMGIFCKSLMLILMKKTEFCQIVLGVTLGYSSQEASYDVKKVLGLYHWQ